jgi:tetratricopeptide (TPR) repeat protein
MAQQLQVIRILAVVLCCLVIAQVPRGRAEGSTWTGKRILTKKPGSQIVAEIGKERNALVNLTDLLYLVECEKGSFVQVRHEAIPFFTVQIQNDKKDARAYACRSIARQEKRDYVGALKDTTEAISLQSSVADWYVLRSALLRDMGKLVDAMTDCKDAISLDPKNASAFISRANVFGDMREYDLAMADCEEAIRLDPKNALAFIARGDVWENKEEYAKALTDYDEAIRLDPMLESAFHNRGSVWLAMKEYDKAFADFSKAIRLDPKDGAAFCNRGTVWWHKNELAKALADYEEAIRLWPDVAQVHKAKAWLLAACDDAKYRDGKKAVQCARRACELCNRDPFCREALAAAYAESGNFKQAIETQKQALAMPGYPKQQVDRARECLKLYEAGKPYRVEKTWK